MPSHKAFCLLERGCDGWSSSSHSGSCHGTVGAPGLGSAPGLPASRLLGRERKKASIVLQFPPLVFTDLGSSRHTRAVSHARAGRRCVLLTDEQLQAFGRYSANSRPGSHHGHSKQEPMLP